MQLNIPYMDRDKDIWCNQSDLQGNTNNKWMTTEQRQRIPDMPFQEILIGSWRESLYNWVLFQPLII